MTDMKATFSIVLVLLALGSFGIEVPALPQSEFADAEVSTNFTFVVGEGSNRNWPGSGRLTDILPED